MFEELNTEINTLLDTIADEQSIYIASNTNYKKYPITSGENFDYSVTEYANFKGSIGYQVTLYKLHDGKNYEKSITYNRMTEDRNKDWTEIVEEEEEIIND